MLTNSAVVSAAVSPRQKQVCLLGRLLIIFGLLLRRQSEYQTPQGGWSLPLVPRGAPPPAGRIPRHNIRFIVPDRRVQGQLRIMLDTRTDAAAPSQATAPKNRVRYGPISCSASFLEVCHIRWRSCSRFRWGRPVSISAHALHDAGCLELTRRAPRPTGVTVTSPRPPPTPGSRSPGRCM